MSGLIVFAIGVVIFVYALFIWALCVTAARADRAEEEARAARTANTRRHLEVVADALAAPGRDEE